MQPKSNHADFLFRPVQLDIDLPAIPNYQLMGILGILDEKMIKALYKEMKSPC